MIAVGSADVVAERHAAILAIARHTGCVTVDSLAETLEATGDRVGALKNYRRSLELNPANTNAKTHIDGLQGK